MARKDATKYVLDVETGKYDYVGMRYYVMADEKDWKRFRVWGTAAALGMLAMFLMSGMSVYGGMNCTYVLAPNVLMMVCGCWLMYHMVKLCRKDMELTEASIRRLMHVSWSSLTGGVLGGLAAVAHVVYSILNGWAPGDARFIVLMALCLPMGVLIFVLERKCPVEQLLIDDLPDEIPEIEA